MGTVNRSIAEQIAKGAFKGDRPVKIVRYLNIFDRGEAFGVVHKGENLMRYEEGGACINPQVWWTKDGGRTEVV